MYEEYWFSSVERLKSFEMKTYELMKGSDVLVTRNRLGNKVYDDSRFRLFKEWFDAKCEISKVHSFYNSSVNGMSIKGIKYMSLQDFAKKYIERKEAFKKISFIEKIDRDIESFKKMQGCFSNDFPDIFNKFKKETLLLIEHFKQFIKNSKEAILLSQEFLKNKAEKDDLKENKYSMIYESIKKKEEKLLNDKIVKPFISIAMQKAIYKIEDKYAIIEREKNISKEEKFFQSIENSIYLYEKMMEVGDLYLKQLKKVEKL